MKYLLTGEETERLKFRKLKPEDFETWTNLFINEQVALFLGLDPKLSPKELTEKWFEKAFHRYENNLGGMNVLIDKKSNEIVGQCGLLIQTVEEVERMEVGYAILPKFWKRGFASEAAIKCKEFGFDNNYWDALISIVNIDNIGSEKVARKNGMTLEKKLDDFKGMPVNIFRIDKIAYEKQTKST